MATPASHEQLNDDELIDERTADDSGTGTGSEWFERNRRVIGIVAAVVAVAVAGLLYYRGVYLPQQNEVALSQMAVAVRNFERDSFNLAIRGTGQFPGLAQLVDEYGATEAGNLSRYYLGVSYLKTGKYAEGIEQLKSFNEGNTLVAASAYAALAYGYEETNAMGDAASAYEKAAGVQENSQSTPFYLSQAARCHEAAGNTDAAVQAWKRINKQYPSAPEAQNAKREIARLTTGK